MAQYNTKKNLGDIINYYLAESERHFSKLTSESIPSLDDAFSNGSNIIIYEKIGNKYILSADTEKDRTKTYYYEDGTKTIQCPACRGEGIVLLPNPTQEDSSPSQESYICPRCEGMKTLARTSNGTPILELKITAIYNENAENSNSSTPIIEYKTVCPGKTAPEWIKEDDILNE